MNQRIADPCYPAKAIEPGNPKLRHPEEAA